MLGVTARTKSSLKAQKGMSKRSIGQCLEQRPVKADITGDVQDLQRAAL
jgi:hypothetical protein